MKNLPNKIREKSRVIFLILIFLLLWGCGPSKNDDWSFQESIKTKWFNDQNKTQKNKLAKKLPVKISVKEDSLLSIVLTDEAKERLGIQTSLVERRTIQKKRNLGGEIITPPGQAITISAPSAGIILDPEESRIPSVGSNLFPNETVLRLLMLPPEKDLITARDNLKVAQNQFSLAKKNAIRAKQLLKEGAGSIRAKDAALSQYVDLRTQLRLAKALVNLLNNHDLNGSAKEFSPLEIGAPIEGLLQDLQVASGQRVSAGSTLFKVVSNNFLWVRVPVYAGILDQIEKEQSATIRNLSNSSQSQEVLVHPVVAPPSGNPQAATVDLFFELSHSDNTFQPGERVMVSLKLRNDENSLIVPRSAVLYDIYGGTWVYINTEGNEFVRSRIELLSIADDWAVLARGPKEGTKIVGVGAAELFGTEFGSGK